MNQKKDGIDLKDNIKKEIVEELKKKYGNGFKEEEIDNLASEILEGYTSIKEKTLLDYLKNRPVEDIAKIKGKEEHRASRESTEVKKEENYFIRFGLNFRLQHILLFTSCIILIITGIPEKFYYTGLAAFFINFVGGMKTITFVHRIGAVGLIAMFAYHCLIYTPFTRQGRKDFIELLPMPKDVTDVIKMIKYFFGYSDEKPKFGRFSYIEKFDYWAVYWGCLIMIGSGFLMWFKVESINMFGKTVVDICKEAHSDEGLLCTLAILIWHFYNVHFNPKVFPMSWVWWNGKISEEDMIEEHPLEYEKIIQERQQKHR